MDEQFSKPAPDNKSDNKPTCATELKPVAHHWPDNPLAMATHWPPVPDISHDLRAPVLPNANPDAISHEEAHAGVSIHLPGSSLMQYGDTLMFYWGLNDSSTQLRLNHVTAGSTVRVLCISYHFINYVQYGLVDLYFEVYRNHQRIGTSPTLRVTVNRYAPPTKRQLQRKRSMSRKYPPY
jgi:hypothetical protein